MSYLNTVSVGGPISTSNSTTSPGGEANVALKMIERI